MATPQARQISGRLRHAAGPAPAALAGALLGCPASEQPRDTAASGAPVAGGAASPQAAASPVLVAAADYAKANELGYVPVLEYHRFGPKEERWTRTPANFRKDLEFLYNNGYYPVNMADVAAKNFAVPAGKKPVVLTFDDSTDGQFRYLKGADGKWKTGPDGKKVIDPDCAVGMLDAFAAKHPDFGRGATFYVLPSGFDQDGVIGEKFKHLVATGREIGNHTWTHESLATMSPAKIEDHLGKLQAFVSKELGKPYPVTTLALPFGIGPRDAAGLAKVVKGGSGATAYHNKVLLLVGSNPAYSPYDKAYKATAVARIQCIDSEFKTWFNRAPGVTKKTTEPWVPFVSDGDPSVVTFPVTWQKKFDATKLGAGQRANPFDPKKVTAAAPVAAVSPTATPVAATASAAPTAATSPATSGQPSPSAVAKGSDTHPGYGMKLPKGGEYREGKIRHQVVAGDSVEALAWKYLRFTDYYTYPKLAAGIRYTNGGSRPLRIGEWLEIPKVREAPPKPAIVKREKTFVSRGVYVTGTTAGSESVWDLIKDLKAHGGNTIVFDAKDMNGKISYDSDIPLARQIKAFDGDMITNLPKFIEKVHAEGIHCVARVAVFHDNRLAARKPQYALKSKRSGGVWRENGDLGWVDPSHPEVQQYQLAMFRELIAAGVDEIQMDYVRFPAQGDTPDIAWHTMKTQKAKHEVITAWTQRAKESVSPTGALLSADVYGVVAWDQGIDVRITGQKLEDMGQHLDVLSPMLYPSHFYSNFDHLAYPPDHPEYFLREGVKKTAKKAGPNVVIRPWLQAFPYRIKNYGPAYVVRQLKGNDEGKGTGWLLWNAENNYKVGFAGVSQYNKGQVAVTAAKR